MADSTESSCLVVDCGPTLSADEFAAARDLTLRIARRQLIYGKVTANGDKVSVFAIGAAETKNDLYQGDEDSDENEEFYGVAVVSPAAKLGIDLLRRVRAMTQGGRPHKVRYAEGIQVAAGHLWQRSGGTSSKHVTLITDGKGKIAGTRDKAIFELLSVASPYIENDMTFNVVLIDGLAADDWKAIEGERDCEIDGSDSDEDDHDPVEVDVGAAPHGGADESNAEDEEEGNQDPCRDCENDEESVRANKRRARRLFSGWRIDHEFERRKRVHERAAAVREHSVPSAGTLLKQTLLARLAHVLGSKSMSLAEASAVMDTPRIKPKKAAVKFHGVLDIGRKVKIPVRTYARVAPATRPSPAKLSWASTVAKRRMVYAKTERRYILPPKKSEAGGGGTAGDGDHGDGENGAEDESRDVDEEDIGELLAYGPKQYPVPDMNSGYSIDYHCEKAFSILFFVRKETIPATAMMGGVDVVLPMSGLEKCGPQRAMRVLCSSMLGLNYGAMARYCSGRGANPKPELMYLWPAKETVRRDEEGGSEEDDSDEGNDVDDKVLGDVFFLNMVKAPLIPDVRNFPHASLQRVLEDVDPEAKRQMARFVAARDLDSDIPRDLMSQETARASTSCPSESEVESPVGGEIPDSEAHFDPGQCCNPTLDRFFVAITERALEGGEGSSGLPEPPDWVKTLMNPQHVLRKANAAAAQSALVSLKNAFPLTEVEALQRKRREQIHVAVESGSELDTSHLLPPPHVENEGDVDMERPFRPEGHEEEEDVVGEYGNATSFGDAPEARFPRMDEEQAGETGDDEDSDDSGGAMSVISECPMVLSRTDPVTDMKLFIRAKRGDDGIQLMSDMVRSLVRDGDVVLAGDCFVALRKACAKLPAQDTFNHLFDRLVGRLHKPSPQGNAATAFLLHMKRDPGRARHLAPLYPREESLVKRMDPAAVVMRSVALAIGKLSLDSHSGDGDMGTTSGVTRSGVIGATQ